MKTFTFHLLVAINLIPAAACKSRRSSSAQLSETLTRICPAQIDVVDSGIESAQAKHLLSFYRTDLGALALTMTPQFSLSSSYLELNTPKIELAPRSISTSSYDSHSTSESPITFETGLVSGTPLLAKRSSANHLVILGDLRKPSALHLEHLPAAMQWIQLTPQGHILHYVDQPAGSLFSILLRENEYRGTVETSGLDYAPRILKNSSGRAVNFLNTSATDLAWSEDGTALIHYVGQPKEKLIVYDREGEFPQLEFETSTKIGQRESIGNFVKLVGLKDLHEGAAQVAMVGDRGAHLLRFLTYKKRKDAGFKEKLSAGSQGRFTWIGTVVFPSRARWSTVRMENDKLDVIAQLWDERIFFDSRQVSDFGKAARNPMLNTVISDQKCFRSTMPRDAIESENSLFISGTNGSLFRFPLLATPL